MLTLTCGDPYSSFEVLKINISDIDCNAWHIKDTIVDRAITQGIDKLNMEVKFLEPISKYLFEIKNPGLKVLEQLNAPQEILYMCKNKIISKSGIKRPEYFNRDDIVCNDKNIDRLRHIIFNKYKDILLVSQKSLKTLDNFKISLRNKEYWFTDSYHCILKSYMIKNAINELINENNQVCN